MGIINIVSHESNFYRKMLVYQFMRHNEYDNVALIVTFMVELILFIFKLHYS